MRAPLKRFLPMFGLVLLSIMRATYAQDTHPAANPPLASGTLDLVLANHNGFVIAADSRMSSGKDFLCAGRPRRYCDNSQKLFRTGQTSALVIAGFAVGSYNTPLDLAVSSLLRKRYGRTGLPGEEGNPEAAAEWSEHALAQALTAVASLYDPTKVSPQDLSLIVTFAGLDKNGAPILRQLRFTEAWKAAGPLNTPAPDYTVASGGLTVTSFQHATVGISCVADAILAGFYKSDDPVIQGYRKKLEANELDSMSLQEMRALAKTILRETRRFTPLVGGEDQIGVFPAKGEAEWNLPKTLPVDTQLSPNFMLWKGLLCTSAQPQCSHAGPGGLTLFQDFQHPMEEPITEFFLASQFKHIPVALDNNYFVGSTFEGATLKWRGGAFFMRANTFNECRIELPEGKNLPPRSELEGKCELIKKREVSVDPSVVGAVKKVDVQGCTSKNADGSVTFSTGGKWGNTAGFIGPVLQP